MINHRIIGQGLLSLKGIMIQIKKKKTKKKLWAIICWEMAKKKKNRLFSIRELSS